MDSAGELWPKTCHFRALPPALVPAGQCLSPSLICQGMCGTSRHSHVPRSVRHSGLVNRLTRGSQAGRAGFCLLLTLPSRLRIAFDGWHGQPQRFHASRDHGHASSCGSNLCGS